MPRPRDSWDFDPFDVGILNEYGAVTVSQVIGFDTEMPISVLIEAVGDNTHAFRKRAIRALGELGPDAAEALPALTGALTDSEHAICMTAAWALGQMGPLAKPAVPALLAMLQDKTSGVRICAGEALMLIDATIITSFPAMIIEALKDDRTLSPSDLAHTLARTGPSTLPALIRAFTDKDPMIRKCAARALGLLGPVAREAISLLVEGLQHDRELPHQDTAWRFSTFGPNDSDCLRAHIIWALVSIGTLTDDAMATLITMVRQESGSVQAYISWALGRQGAAAAPAVPVLMEALSDASNAQRSWAAWALAEIGPAATQAVPVLIHTLSDPNAHVRSLAAEALEQIGPCPDVVPALIQALYDDAEQVKVAAARALGRMGMRNLDVLIALIEVSRTRDFAVREQAIRALTSLGYTQNDIVNYLHNHLMDDCELLTTRLRAFSTLQEFAPTAAKTIKQSFFASLKPPETTAGIEGLEVMPEAFLKKTQAAFRTFRTIGQMCRRHNSNTFKAKRAASLLDLGERTIGNHMDTVSVFFRDFFEKHRGVRLLPDDDEGRDTLTYESLKLFERRKGIPSLIYPRGWEAWTLACEFLTRLEEKERSGGSVR
jgi:HEAT repeat protein